MYDLHTHTAFSDGARTAEEMVRAALEKGMTCIGFSEHSTIAWDECGMRPETVGLYRAEAARLKSAYDGRIRVLCGLERDYYSDDGPEYDYVIGSVHWIRMPDGHPLPIDWTADRLRRDVERYFSGDWYALAEAYYALEADVVRKTRCGIIGHFDLLTKFNERERTIDEDHPRYRAAWRAAADALLETGAVFEVNTGAMSRGYRTAPYPSAEIRAYLAAHGARMILSSDAHRPEHIAWEFGRFPEIRLPLESLLSDANR